MPRIGVEVPAVEESTAAVTDGLRAFNLRHTTSGDRDEFNVVLYSDDGAVVGGCLCETRWHWLFVHILWVGDEYRGAGMGTALLAAAETEARRRGCTKAHLDTASFQARPFYESLGWRVFGTLEDHPPGHTRYFLQKDIGQPA